MPGNIPAAFGVGGGASGAMPAPGAAAAGHAPNAAAMAPVPTPRPGLMENVQNPSWWGAIGDSEAMQQLPGQMMQMGGRMNEQAQQAPAPPPMPAQANPQALQMAMQIMQQLEQRGAGRPQLPGGPQMQGGMPGGRF